MKYFLQLMALLLCAMFSACSSDEPNNPDNASNKSSVTIKADGSTSTGVAFSPIDETTFFLDYIKYSIVDSHLEIVGYDPIEIADYIKPYAAVTYLGVTYNTRVIGDDAFKQCTKIKSITLPDGLKTIGADAFSGCAGLTSVSFPDGLEIIEPGAFSGCEGLVSISLPNGLKFLDGGIFEGCAGLTTVSLPEDIEIIHKGAFMGCGALISVKSLAANPPKFFGYQGQQALPDNTCQNGILYVPSASVDLYKNAYIWKDFVNIQGI